MRWPLLSTWLPFVASAVSFLLGAGLMAWWKLAEVVKDRTIALQGLAKTRENERLVYSVRESQISGLMYVISMGQLVEASDILDSVVADAPVILVRRADLETALVAGGMQIRMRNGIVLGQKQ